MAMSRRKFLLGAGYGLGSALVGAGAGIGFMTSGSWLRESGIPRAMPVTTLTDLPAEADVVVIGAGIAGISTALYLNEKGFNTVVLEKGVVAGEQSSRAFGWIYSNGWDYGKLPLTNQSKALWQGFAARFGEDIGYRQSGNFTLIDSDEGLEMYQGWLKGALEIQPQMDSRIVTGAEMDSLIPGASQKFKAALYQASDGTAEPTYSVSKIAMGAMREGVKIVAPCAARSVERQGGKIAGVYTELGYIKAKYVVIAGGAWSSLFAGNLGIRVPQLTLASSMQRLSHVEGALPGAGYGPDFTWRMQANGETSVGVNTSAAPITKDSFRYLFDFMPALEHSSNLLKVRFSNDFFKSLGVPSSWANDEVTPFEKVRMLSGEVDRYENDTALANLRRAFPQYEKAAVLEEWAGMIDATPDSTQYVTEIPDNPGLFLITGFSGNGLTTGPASGQLIAEMIAGEKTTVDPAIYRFDRFTDGSEFVFRH
jgi:glycine/D-amino acid oxidase-like deaminating enzyme